MPQRVGVQPPPPEFSRPLRTATLSAEGERVEAEATPEEREALARRFGVKAVPRLAMEARVMRDGEGWRVEGVARGKLVQRCVVTLVDVSRPFEERFARRLLPGVPPPDLSDLDPEEDEDPPEPLGAVIDPGEMAAEAVALAIDPYPRAEGVVFEGRRSTPEGAEPDEPRKENPFAGLAALRGRFGEGEEGEGNG